MISQHFLVQLADCISKLCIDVQTQPFKIFSVKILPFLFLGAASMVHAQVGAKIDEIHMRNAAFTEVILKHCTATKVEPDGVRVTHDAGVTKVPLQYLPEAWKPAVPVDVAAIKAFQEKQQQDATKYTEWANKEKALAEKNKKEGKVLPASTSSMSEVTATTQKPQTSGMHIVGQVVEIVRTRYSSGAIVRIFAGDTIYISDRASTFSQSPRVETTIYKSPKEPLRYKGVEYPVYTLRP